MSQALWRRGVSFTTALSLGFILLVLAIPGAFVIGFGKRNIGIGYWPALLPVLAGIGIWIGLMRLQETKSKAVGETIISALEEFRADRGKYPEKLDELVPAFLPSIPKTEMRLTAQDFFYSPWEGSYSLGFKYADWKMSMWDYDSRLKEWTRSPSS